MSDRVEPSQYIKRLADYLLAFNPADSWQRADFLKRVRTEMARLTYFQIQRAEVVETLDPMIRIHGSFMLTKRVSEMVQLDLGTVWNSLTTDSERAVHTFTATAEGFEGRYLCVTNGVLTTVTMRVLSTR